MSYKTSVNCSTNQASIVLAFAHLILCVFLLVSFSKAERLPIKTYTVADGLLRDNVAIIKQDSRGFLWFCTSDGISRFDGYGFTNFTTSDGLPDRHANDFLETQMGEILIATEGGLAKLDLQADSKNRLSNGNATDFVGGIVQPRVERNVVSLGGGIASNGQYTLVSTLGESIARQTSVGGTYNLASGFWAIPNETRKAPGDYDGDGRLDAAGDRPVPNAFVP